jgi:subtilisin family serine protease
MRPRLIVPRLLAIVAATALAASAAAEEITAWALKDPEADGVEGTRTERAYRELDLKPPAEPIIVAVIDSGIDITHPDLKDVIWTNPKEAAGKDGVDDDGNGFVDDLHGWNFIGNKDGKQELVAGRMEVTRELKRLETLAAAGTLSEKDATRMERIKAAYEQEKQGRAQALTEGLIRVSLLDEITTLLGKEGVADPTPAAIKLFDSRKPSAQALKQLFLQLDENGAPLAKVHEQLQGEFTELDRQYGEDFEESAVIGDDPTKLDEKGYGNPIVFVPENAFHGTHVAGIIGAVRGNGIGTAGQCAWVRIMPVRAVPDGDERDKDVANAVRYAVDNGAKIINMSFGKGISPNKAYVDAAFRYAAEKGVLLVHAAGNDAQDNDQEGNFPNRRPLVGDDGAAQPEIDGWIEVGASSSKKGDHLVAPFSNYGKTAVDLFAPGTRIESTVPGGGVASADGTSMASPECAGVAALVWSQHPELSAKQLKQALMDNVRKYPDLKVIKPGTRSQRVDFDTLSVSGGIVDAYATLKALAPKEDGADTGAKEAGGDKSDVSGPKPDAGGDKPKNGEKKPDAKAPDAKPKADGAQVP